MTIRIDCGTTPNSKRFGNSRLQIDVRGVGTVARQNTSILWRLTNN